MILPKSAPMLHPFWSFCKLGANATAHSQLSHISPAPGIGQPANDKKKSSVERLER